MAVNNPEMSVVAMIGSLCHAIVARRGADGETLYSSTSQFRPSVYLDAADQSVQGVFVVHTIYFAWRPLLQLRKCFLVCRVGLHMLMYESTLTEIQWTGTIRSGS
jgi:hypothetical protein